MIFDVFARYYTNRLQIREQIRNRNERILTPVLKVGFNVKTLHQKCFFVQACMPPLAIVISQDNKLFHFVLLSAPRGCRAKTT